MRFTSQKKSPGTFTHAAAQETTVFQPQLTSLIDVMTFLLIFLVKTFSVEGDIITPSRDLELPLSSSQKRAQVVTTVEISRAAIMAEGKVIAPFSSFTGSDEQLVKPLQAWLKQQLAIVTDTAKKREIMIQSDREVPFDIVKRVMYTCSKAGYEDYSILVIQEE